MNINKKLRQAYLARFTTLNERFFESSDIGLALFIEYLRYLRDSLIVSKNCTQNEFVLTSLITAIAEYEAFQLDNEDSKKQFHWNSFWETVKQNMEDWIATNDSV